MAQINHVAPPMDSSFKDEFIDGVTWGGFLNIEINTNFIIIGHKHQYQYRALDQLILVTNIFIGGQ
jgi:hypothetical protein